MNNNMQRFMDSVESLNSKKVIKYVFKKIDYVSIEELNSIQLEQLIINTKPKSPKEIITITYVLSSYAKWINDDNLYQMIQSLDKKLLWEKIKPFSKNKFISYEQYKNIIKDIALYEEYNALYYELLFKCIYEGIYNDDLSVIKNLRASDINNNIITLHEDNGHSYKIKVSDRLASELKQLASINVWERRNRYGICKVNMRGVYRDSVFKIEDRNTSSEGSYKFTYYSKLRKIAKEYLEYSLLPLHLYASGIMHRIKIELNKNGIQLEEAFADNSRDKMSHLIISKELVRCNSNIEVGNFREIVKGHLDSF